LRGAIASRARVHYINSNNNGNLFLDECRKEAATVCDAEYTGEEWRQSFAYLFVASQMHVL